jgi:prepilin-type N-terminal cleavage/methylation domain-containing protein
MLIRLRLEALQTTRGFSLIETLVATTLLTIAVGGLAHLATAATSTNQRARSTTLAALLASSKVEELLAVPWNDQLTQASNGDASIERNVPGFYDLLDASGRPPANGRGHAAYRRRWSVRRFAEDPDSGLVIHVVVTGLAPAGGPRVLARMVTVRARRDWWEPAS